MCYCHACADTHVTNIKQPRLRHTVHAHGTGPILTMFKVPFNAAILIFPTLKLLPLHISNLDEVQERIQIWFALQGLRKHSMYSQNSVSMFPCSACDLYFHKQPTLFLVSLSNPNSAKLGTFICSAQTNGDSARSQQNFDDDDDDNNNNTSL